MSKSSSDGAVVGKAAPDFALPDQDGAVHCLKDYRGRWVVLYFYPRDNTPGCTSEACGFRDRQDDLAGSGAVVLGVSADNEASHRKFAEKYALSFPLLADTEAQVCRAYGVWQPKKMFGREYLGVQRKTFLIDPQGKLAHRWDKVKVKQHAEEVLEKLSELGG